MFENTLQCFSMHTVLKAWTKSQYKYSNAERQEAFHRDHKELLELGFKHVTEQSYSLLAFFQWLQTSSLDQESCSDG